VRCDGTAATLDAVAEPEIEDEDEDEDEDGVDDEDEDELDDDDDADADVDDNDEDDENDAALLKVNGEAAADVLLGAAGTLVGRPFNVDEFDGGVLANISDAVYW
jgi:hypothetical protein